jgi:replicative DNA helicase
MGEAGGPQMTMPTFDEQLELSALSLCLDLPEFLYTGPSTDQFAVHHIRTAHATLCEMRRRGDRIDDITLRDELMRRGVSQAAGLALLQAARESPKRGQASVVSMMRKLYERRTVAELAAQGQAQAIEGNLDEARALLAKAAFSETGDLRAYTLADAMEAAAVVWDQAERSRAGEGRSKFVPLGLCPTIDSLVMVGPGDTVIIGAETSVGKSSSTMTCLLKHQQKKIHAGLVTVEDPREDWGAKAAGYYGKIDTQPFWSGQVAGLHQVASSIAEAAKEVQYVRIVDVPSGALSDVLRAMTALVKSHGARILFVDYLQAIRAPESLATASTKAQTDHVYQTLQATARMLEVPLVITSQLSRGDSEHGAEPSIKRLKESGNLENGAQIVLMLWCEDEENTIICGKAAKMKRVRSRPRWSMRRGNGGVLVELEGYQVPPQKRAGRGRD